MKLEIPDAITKLSAHLGAKKLMIFAGSGMSIESGLPTWDVFIKDFIEFCDQFKTLTGVDRDEFESMKSGAENYLSSNPAILASVFRNWLIKLQDRQDLNIESQFDDWFTNYFAGKLPNLKHDFIVKTNYEYILTTNYDLLMENAAKNSGFTDLANRSFGFKDSSRIALNISNDTPMIVHLHGKYTNVSVDEVVFTSEDYTNMMKKRYPGFRFAIQSLFLRFNALFVGYGGNDPHMEDIVDELSYFTNYKDDVLPRIYLVVKRDKYDLIYDKYKEKLRTDIIVIDNYNDYHTILSELASRHPRM